MLVPEGGRGDVRQISVSRRQVRAAAGGASALVLALTVGTAANFWSVPVAIQRDEVVAENAALQARLADVDKRIAALEPLIDRVRAYDEQLRQLGSREALPGFGPLDTEEAEARQAWIDGEIGRAHV